MSSLPLLTLMMAVPFVGALVILFLPHRSAGSAKPIALGASLLTLALALVAWSQWSSDGPQFQLTETHAWIPQFGVSYALGVDGIALSLILMSTVLAPVCILAAWNDLGEGAGDDPGRTKVYFALMLSLVTFIVGVFAATDVFLFYIFFEAMLLPIYFLIGLFGGPGRKAASMKFILYGLVGGLVMLVGVIALYFVGPGGEQGFLIENLIGKIGGSVEAQRWIFLSFFIALAIKAPLWPLHTWLPDAAGESRPATATLLVGVLDKVGTFGMIRYCLTLFPEASKWATPVVITLAVISVLYGAILAIGQSDMMRLIAFISVSHFGFIVMGIFAMTSTAGSGAALYMINHGFSTAGLFLVVGFLIVRHGSQDIPDYGGWQRITPVLAGSFLVAGMSSLALPGLSPFVSEWLVLAGTYQRYTVAVYFAIIGTVLAALYILLMYKRVMTGPRPELGDAAPPDLNHRERWVVAPVIAILIVLGFYPKPIFDLVNPTVQQTMTQMGVTDPAPMSASGSTK